MPTPTLIPTRIAEVPQLLRLLHLASPVLPIGAFHFSQGLEYAVEAGWVRDERTALEWIEGLGSASLNTLDLPALLRLRAAWGQDDTVGVLRWNALLIACRETAELREEDRHLGGALLRVLAELGLSDALFAAGMTHRPGVSHACAFAFASARWQISAEAMIQAFAWAWVENQVLAAVKLIPLGQSAGQRMLCALSARIPSWVERARGCTDADMGVGTVMAAVASGLHETQYTRLYRS
jgi:urease accessory protein